jgi:hypothetical protein
MQDHRQPPLAAEVGQPSCAPVVCIQMVSWWASADSDQQVRTADQAMSVLYWLQD